MTDVTGIARRSAVRLADTASKPAPSWPTPIGRLCGGCSPSAAKTSVGTQRHAGHAGASPRGPSTRLVSRGGSIGRASRQWARVHAFVVRNVERLVEALHYYRIVCDQLTLSLLFTDAPERVLRSSLLGSTSDFEQLCEGSPGTVARSLATALRCRTLHACDRRRPAA